jgi:hypothetical protein
MLDIFQNDAFSVVNLTDAINNLDFIPGRIGQLGIFNESGITSLAAVIEQKDGILELIGPTPRGGPGHTLPKGPRNLRAVAVPHFEINDSVMADEVQGVRAWGTETQLETVMGKVAERQQLHTNSLEATHEYSRIGAVKGEVQYADGSTLNLFDLFGVTQEPEIDFDLDNPTPTAGALRQQCAAVVRMIAGKLGATPFTGVYAFVGDDFFDALISHPEVRDTFMGWTAAAELRQGYVQTGLSFGAFPFGGIMWDNYRGAVGGTQFIDPVKAHLFPIGVPNLFRTYFAPADYIETVNTVGQPRYTKQYEMPNGKGIALDSQMNSLDICTRPGVLLVGTI